MVVGVGSDTHTHTCTLLLTMYLLMCLIWNCVEIKLCSEFVKCKCFAGFQPSCYELKMNSFKILYKLWQTRLLYTAFVHGFFSINYEYKWLDKSSGLEEEEFEGNLSELRVVEFIETYRYFFDAISLVEILLRGKIWIRLISAILNVLNFN